MVDKVSWVSLARTRFVPQLGKMLYGHLDGLVVKVVLVPAKSDREFAVHTRITEAVGFEAGIEISVSSAVWYEILDVLSAHVLKISGTPVSWDGPAERTDSQLKAIAGRLETANSDEATEIFFLSRIATEWLVAHEMSHYKRGHLHWIKQEEQSDRMNMMQPQVLAAIELDADLQASQFVAQTLLQEFGPGFEGEIARSIIVAVGSLIFLWKYQKREANTYPSNNERLCSLFGAFGEWTTAGGFMERLLQAQDELRRVSSRLGQPPVENIMHAVRYGSSVGRLECLFSIIRRYENEWAELVPSSVE